MLTESSTCKALLEYLDGEWGLRCNLRWKKIGKYGPERLFAVWKVLEEERRKEKEKEKMATIPWFP